MMLSISVYGKMQYISFYLTKLSYNNGSCQTGNTIIMSLLSVLIKSFMPLGLIMLCPEILQQSIDVHKTGLSNPCLQKVILIFRESGWMSRTGFSVLIQTVNVLHDCCKGLKHPDCRFRTWYGQNPLLKGASWIEELVIS